MYALTHLHPATSGIETVLASIPVGLSTAAAAAVGTIIGGSLCRRFQLLSGQTVQPQRAGTCHTGVLLLMSFAMVSAYNLSSAVVEKIDTHHAAAAHTRPE